jgi:hypothetical protein
MKTENGATKREKCLTYPETSCARLSTPMLSIGVLLSIRVLLFIRFLIYNSVYDLTHLITHLPHSLKTMAHVFDSSTVALPSTSSTQLHFSPELSIPAPTKPRQSILITMGPCMWKEEEYQCNCAVGSCISDFGATLNQAFCKKCCHPMSTHSGYGKSLAPTTTITC